MTRRAELIAVDWGTTRLRASLLDGEGHVLGQAQSEAGVQSVPAGGFPQAFEALCGAWLDADPNLPVLMAGMVGSRNGWAEAPYVACPCGPNAIAAQLLPVAGLRREALIVPGVDIRFVDGSYDVMRGEETQALGCGVADGLLCLPGTHCKWIEMAGGAIQRFATFITGELFAAVTQSFIGRLAAEPDDAAAGQGAALRASRAAGGLTRNLFQARALVLSGDLPPSGVRPYLSRLLIEAEIDAALDLFGQVSQMHLVAGEPHLSAYRAAFEARHIVVQAIDPAAASLAGLGRIMAARSGRGETQ